MATQFRFSVGNLLVATCFAALGCVAWRNLREEPKWLNELPDVVAFGLWFVMFYMAVASPFLMIYAFMHNPGSRMLVRLLLAALALALVIFLAMSIGAWWYMTFRFI